MAEDKSHVQIRQGDRLEQKIIKSRVLSIEEADREITKDYRESK